MNIFVPCTGRCGSMTFARACGHISNYTSAHESIKGIKPHTPKEALRYPSFHIEVDNRLSWFLERLELIYGPDTFYVHLKRDTTETARSQFNHRMGVEYLWKWHKKIMRTYQDITPDVVLDVCVQHCNIINEMIASFLKDKSNKMDFSLENSKKDFTVFWKRIKAEGDLKSALGEWDVKYNATKK